MINTYIRNNDWNEVEIEGILCENNLTKTTYKNKDGKSIQCIRGNLLVRVEQDGRTNDIPVSFFANMYKNDGSLNSQYKSLETIMNEYTSMASATAEAKADYVKIKKATIEMNEYPSKNTGNLVSFPRIRGSFCEKVRPEAFNPHATFKVRMMIANTNYEVDSEGCETGRYRIEGLVPGYGDSLHKIPFIAENKNVINVVSSYWTRGDTVVATGKLVFSVSTEKIVTEVDFGEPIEQVRTTKVSEIVITGGAQNPLDEDQSFDTDYINRLIKIREERLNAEKAKSSTKKETSKTPSDINDPLGF